MGVKLMMVMMMMNNNNNNMKLVTGHMSVKT